MIRKLTERHLLSGLECKVVVLPSVCCVNLGEVESLWKEIVDQSTKSDAIGPRRGEVFNLNVLQYSNSDDNKATDGSIPFKRMQTIKRYQNF